MVDAVITVLYVANKIFVDASIAAGQTHAVDDDSEFRGKVQKRECHSYLCPHGARNHSRPDLHGAS